MIANLRLDFDDALPISGAVDEIRAALEQHQVIVVAGETGSGKTTQLPKICLLAGRRHIGHTQPRRLAARTVADRIAQELGVELGDAVGYQVRFTRQASKQTAIKVMTDGILLAEIAHDRELRAYDTIIIDEAHERSLNIDFLLGYLKQLLPRRPDLKVIVTSATIDTARFSAHFNDAPIIEVSGRTYPVEVLYEPPHADQDEDLIDSIGSAVTMLHAQGDGDILVFLSGEREIRDTAEVLRSWPALQSSSRPIEVLPLYARLSFAEQQRVFQPHAGTRVILATNVAETSITVPGIRYVVDTGLARISRYSARTKVQRLPIEPISQASANQRAGRCGRLGPGVCIRLYAEDDFNARPEFTEPEILRTNLASVILQMLDARLGPIHNFPFVEPPDASHVRDGIRLLRELGAIEEQRPDARGVRHRLTPTGRLLARLPVDPRLGRMLVEAERLGVFRDTVPVVAALAIPDVRERPSEQQQHADQLHRRFWSEPGAEGAPLGPRDPSDITAILRLWRYLRQQRRALSGNAFRRMCRDEFLNYLRIREWQDLATQLRDISQELDWGQHRSRHRQSRSRRKQHRIETEQRSNGPDVDGVHRAVLTGLLSHIGLKEVAESSPQKRRGRRPITQYVGARGAKFAIQPGSAAAKSEPELVMAVELVETSRLWARTVAPVRADWVEEAAAHVVKRSYSEPRWSVRQGQCVADEKVSLYGMPLVAARTVSYGRIDPIAARDIFIQSALVEGQWRTRHRFFARNERVRAEAEDIEERTRRRGLVIDDRTLFDFYDERIPAGITSVAHFDRWWREQRRKNDRLLDLHLDDLIDSDEVADDDFPEVWTVGEHTLPMSYTFDPGSSRDGVTVELDVSTLNQVDAAPFSWHVPGMRLELATELIRRLPKVLRVNFVPAPDWASRALDWLENQPEQRQRSFPDALATALTQLSGTPVDAALFDLEALPEHLAVRYTVVDLTQPPRDQELGTGRDLDTLQRRFAPALNERLNTAAPEFTHPGATSWQFGSLPMTVKLGEDTSLVGYPALVDQGDTVGVRIANTAERASRWQVLGLRRLITLATPDPTKSVFAHLTMRERLALSHSPQGDIQVLLAEIRLRATADLIVRQRINPNQVRDEQAFVTACDQVRPDAAGQMQRAVGVVSRILERYQEVQRLLETAPDTDSAADVRAQVDNLIFPGFIAATPEPHLSALERYLRAIDMRIASWSTHPARERQGLDIITDLEDAYAAATAHHPVGELPLAAVTVGWMLEELRVSLFAQSLGTAHPVSAKRVRRAIDALTRPDTASS